MVSSFWKDNYPNAKVGSIRKLFYDRYSYRVELYIYNVWLAVRGIPSNRKLSERAEHIKTLRKTRDDIKIRVEHNRIQIYATDEQTLIDIVKELDKLDGSKPVDGLVRVINYPKEGIELKPGIRLVSRDRRFKYEVKIRSTIAVRKNLESICRYMENLDQTDAELRGRDGVGMLVRTNDLSSLDFLRLISPGCIGKIIELVPDEA